jgi:PTH1 family peptidyl-tRNA hydrolase
MPFSRPQAAPEDVHLIVGLGNPGSEYAGSRHNVGFACLQVLAKRHRLTFDAGRSRARIARGTIQGSPVVLARPQTYMNLSGQAVHGLMQWLRIGPGRLLVVHDDLDLPVGRIRLRPGGSAGGHRGMLSVIQQVGTSDFPRLRVGIGRPASDAANHGAGDAIDHVLSEFDSGERPLMRAAYERAADAMECLLAEGLEAAMNRFNAEAAPPAPDAGNALS